MIKKILKNILFSILTFFSQKKVRGKKNIVILNNDEFRELYIWINKKNTVLSKCEVGIIGEYRVKKKSSNKRIIDII
jgi:hypothetical protein